MTTDERIIHYAASFLNRNELESRQGIYLEKATIEVIKQIIHNIGDGKLTISGFVENVLQHHFENYKEEINTLYTLGFSKPIK